MIEVMIAEDESLIRKKLVHFPDYNSLGMTVVKEVENGKEGVEYIKSHNPQIIIADINMPYKNGLEMIAETLDYDYIAIIISGYNYFDYAQKALKYGVTDYILKPVSIKELEDALSNAKNIIEEKNKLLYDTIDLKLLSSLSLNTEISDKTVNEMIEYIHHNYEKKISINDLTQNLMYSESMLNKKFKNEVKITFNEYLNRYRIKKSIDYLKNSNYNITEISTLTGFSNAQYFSRVFKKYIGKSPSDIIKTSKN